jgi:hypothetical protein
MLYIIMEHCSGGDLSTRPPNKIKLYLKILSGVTSPRYFSLYTAVIIQMHMLDLELPQLLSSLLMQCGLGEDAIFTLRLKA